MILKDYQAQAIKNLEDFLQLLDENKSISKSFADFWTSRDVTPRPPYQNNIPGVPQVCFKVPTGGGKTFMATASLKSIFDILPNTQSKVVVWLVPSDTILTQTYKNLSEPTHPYHQRLESDFNGQVAIYTKAQLLASENFSPAEVAEQLSILVLSYDSFRTYNKEGRKAYQQNGQLNQFVSHFNKNEELLANADESSLIQVIRHYRPIIIVDESHHATTSLSLEMLRNFNPSFILELTATPKNTSNIIAYVPAAKLKAAGMVKLPVIVYNRLNQQDVISDAIDFRNLLEHVGQAENIRPIVLFQAETRGQGEHTTFDKIKNFLIRDHNISAEQIAIKTADINELRNVDLMANDCPIRYIITINALKEGWDCPFAYILASLANRSSAVDVEQILGRILRKPYIKNFSERLLNMSYVFTSSNDFHQTINKIVVGLNAAGFSEREYRVATNIEPTVDSSQIEPATSSQQNTSQTENPTESSKLSENNSTVDMEKQARQADIDYNSNNTDTRPDDEQTSIKTFSVRDKFKDTLDFQLPQFFITEDTGEIFEGIQDVKVSKDILSRDFTLANKDTSINFDNLDYEIASLDIYEDNDYPQYKSLSISSVEVKALLEHFNGLTTDSQIHQCAAKISAIVDRRRNFPSSQDILAYVTKIVSNFDSERLRDSIINTGAYAKKITEKIDEMQTEYAEETFLAQIQSGKIFLKPSYKLPSTISLLDFNLGWVNSLYNAEANDDINKLEWHMAFKLTELDNVLWWHRNGSKPYDFCLNTSFNHYPDFIVRAKSGMIIIVETKGTFLSNPESKQKIELGRIWETKSGIDSFRYFMVFDSSPPEGAVSLDDFMSIVKKF
ncbi:MAG: DEAD/DEAH box helicase family protein [Selenomonadaceae bacterium]|nr:DEAD/DEAH box helicase family protein [Selenomonadaceae bacterium]